MASDFALRGNTRLFRDLQYDSLIWLFEKDEKCSFYCIFTLTAEEFKHLFVRGTPFDSSAND
jgi:hypothetical protein